MSQSISPDEMLGYVAGGQGLAMAVAINWLVDSPYVGVPIFIYVCLGFLIIGATVAFESGDKLGKYLAAYTALPAMILVLGLGTYLGFGVLRRIADPPNT